MKKLLCCAVAVALFSTLGTARAEDLKSGLQPGDTIGAFDVEKCAGNDKDGVEVGKVLCYRCRLGNRPTIAVFAHSADSKLAALMKELDAVVAKNEDKKAASFVTLLGDNADKAKQAAKALVAKAKTENIAVVVPLEHANGPEHLKLNPKADVTVLIYSKGKIEANHALAAGKLNAEAIKKIVADTSKILD